MKTVRAVAIVCARNEAWHIQSCLRDLIAEGLEVVLIDNGSTDDTVALAQPFLGRGLLTIEHMPWEGKFALREQVRQKLKIFARLDHDWMVHVDADEWLQSPVPGETLVQAITRADWRGYDCINFEEFVFVPLTGEDFTGTDYRRLMRTYYFFEPGPVRCIRAWKRPLPVTAENYTGHVFHGLDVMRFPASFPIRHYIFLSHAQACQKLVGRQFAESELKEGMHFNRVNLRPEDLIVRPSPYLKTLPDAASPALDRRDPARVHSWQWK